MHGVPGSRDAAAPRPDRRRFALACAAGALLALIPFTWLGLSGRLDLAQSSYLGGFYDAQAHSFLEGRWDVDPDVLSIEAFTIDGKAYMYFGPTPALLRLPVAALTSRFDGRLTALSLLLAFGVFLAASSTLGWRIRRLVRGDAPVDRGEAVLAGATTFLLGAGTPVLFLASDRLVYHEAIAWAVALATASYAALLGYTSGGSRRSLVAAGVLGGLALLSRASVGLGPVAAIGFVLALQAVRAARAGPAERRRALPELALLAALVVVPVGLHVGVNEARFGTALRIPWEAQKVSEVDAARQAFLRRSGGDLQGVRFAPTTLLQYVRPDALSAHRQFPWVGFPRRAVIVGDVPFDVIDRSSSVVATAPWLLVLAGVGIAHLASRSEQGRRLRAAVGPLLVGAVVVTPLTLAIAYVAHRYVADFVPLLLLPGVLGLQVLAARGRGALRVLVPVALLGAVACWVNFSLALGYQRTFSPTTDPQQRAELVRWQERVDDLLPGNQAPLVRSVAPDDPLPRRAEEGTLAVVGRCRALLQWDGGQWRELEVGNGGGHFRLHLVLPDTPVGEAVPVLTGPTGGTLSVERRPGDRVRFRFEWPGHPPTMGAEVAAGRPGRERVLEARIDRRLHSVEVRLDGDNVLGVLQYSAPADDLAPAPGYPGDLRNEPPSTATCRSVLPGAS